MSTAPLSLLSEPPPPPPAEGVLIPLYCPPPPPPPLTGESHVLWVIFDHGSVNGEESDSHLLLDLHPALVEPPHQF